MCVAGSGVDKVAEDQRNVLFSQIIHHHESSLPVIPRVPQRGPHACSGCRLSVVETPSFWRRRPEKRVREDQTLPDQVEGSFSRHHFVIMSNSGSSSRARRRGRHSSRSIRQKPQRSFHEPADASKSGRSRSKHAPMPVSHASIHSNPCEDPHPQAGAR